MSVLQNSKSALCHEDIEQRLPEKMDRVTVYRILQSFCDDGKVHKIISSSGKTCYALCRHCSAGNHHDDHPHFHCIACNAITCVRQSVARQKLPRGYRAVSAISYISGYCKKCSELVKPLCFLAAFFAVQAACVAQTPDSIHELPEIMITESASRLQGENVMSVERLNVKNISIQGVSFTDKLSSVAGVSALTTGAGVGKPVIRGLSGSRIAVFAQGIRLENQQWGDEHGLGLDENGYESVEIVKGPASLLYGSNALGGALYFVDERYAPHNSAEAAFNSEFNSNTLGFRNSGAFKMSRNRLHWNLFGGYATHADYSDGNSNRVPNSRFNAGNLKTALGYVGDKYTAALKYSFLAEKYGLTETDEDGHDGEAEIYRNGRTPSAPYQDLNTHIVSAENTFFFDGGSKLKIDAGYVFNNRKEFEDEHDNGRHEAADADGNAALDMNLHTFSYSAKWYSPRWRERWTLTAGSQAMAQNNVNRGKETLMRDAKTYDFGVFAVTDFYYSKKSYWQFGLRFDMRKIASEPLDRQYYSCNFSTGIYQSLAKDLSLRLNLSSGFRTPDMYELLSDGVHHGTNRYETGNRDLKTENSYQTDVSLNYSVMHVEFFINPFFNYIRNYIYLQPVAGTVDGFPVFRYAQNDAFLYGGEAGFHLHPHPLDWLHIEGSYSNVFGQDMQHNCLSLTPPQKINATVGASFPFRKTVEQISIYLQNRYSLAQNRVAANETPTPAYNLLNAGVVLDLNIKSRKIQLNLTAGNLLNETYCDHLSRYKYSGIYNIGRSFVAKISMPIV